MIHDNDLLLERAYRGYEVIDLLANHILYNLRKYDKPYTYMLLNVYTDSELIDINFMRFKNGMFVDIRHVSIPKNVFYNCDLHNSYIKRKNKFKLLPENFKIVDYDELNDFLDMFVSEDLKNKMKESWNEGDSNE